MVYWKHTFFQVVSTVSNHNFKIDRMLVEPSRKIIILLDNKRYANLESRAHVYYMSHTVHEAGVVDDFVMRRTQVLSVAFDLDAADMYLFNQHGSNHLSLLFCNKILSEPACMYFMAKIDGNEDIGAFERSEDFPLLKYLSVRPDKNIDKLQKPQLLIAQTNVSGLLNEITYSTKLS